MRRSARTPLRATLPRRITLPFTTGSGGLGRLDRLRVKPSIETLACGSWAQNDWRSLRRR